MQCYRSSDLPLMVLWNQTLVWYTSNILTFIFFIYFFHFQKLPSSVLHLHQHLKQIQSSIQNDCNQTQLNHITQHKQNKNQNQSSCILYDSSTRIAKAPFVTLNLSLKHSAQSQQKTYLREEKSETKRKEWEGKRAVVAFELPLLLSFLKSEDKESMSITKLSTFSAEYWIDVVSMCLCSSVPIPKPSKKNPNHAQVVTQVAISLIRASTSHIFPPSNTIPTFFLSQNLESKPSPPLGQDQAFLEPDYLRNSTIAPPSHARKAWN